MRFEQRIFLYRVNEDNTVTFYTKNFDDTKRDYFRANARLKLLFDLSEMDKDTELMVSIGIYYDRQIKLQLIEIIS